MTDMNFCIIMYNILLDNERDDFMSETLHEYRDKDGNLVRVRRSSSGEVYIESYDGNERDPENHSRLTVKISSGDGKPTGHDDNRRPLK